MSFLVKNQADLDQYLENYHILDQDYELIDIPERLEQEKAQPASSFMKNVWTRFIANKGAMIGGIIIIFIILSICVPLMSSWNGYAVATSQQSMAPRVPILESIGIFTGKNRISQYTGQYEFVYHYFGTDTLGRDLWVRVWSGCQISRFVAATAVVVNVCIGILYGMISGYFGGIVDSIMQRFQEIVNSISTLVVLTLLLIVMSPGLWSIIVALIITSWIGMARITRAQVLQIKEREFILASKTLGASGLYYFQKDFAEYFRANHHYGHVCPFQCDFL